MLKMLLVFSALSLSGFLGCGDDPTVAPLPTPTPAPIICTGPPVLSVNPVAGYPGIYTVNLFPLGYYSLSVNATAVPVENGSLVFAKTGDLLQAYGFCGFTQVVVIR